MQNRVPLLDRKVYVSDILRVIVALLVLVALIAGVVYSELKNNYIKKTDITPEYIERVEYIVMEQKEEEQNELNILISNEIFSRIHISNFYMLYSTNTQSEKFAVYEVIIPLEDLQNDFDNTCRKLNYMSTVIQEVWEDFGYYEKTAMVCGYLANDKERCLIISENGEITFQLNSYKIEDWIKEYEQMYEN